MSGESLLIGSRNRRRSQPIHTGPSNTARTKLNPAANAALTIVTMLGSVVKKLDFYRSKCAITTMDGNVQHTKTVTHYQEPPKPKTPTSGPADEPTSQPAATPPAKSPGG